MRICHHTLKNGSGLNRISTAMALAEKRSGHDSFLSYTNDPTLELKFEDPYQVSVVPSEKSLEADIHVIHSHLPDGAKGKTVFVAHGTPEHCFNVTMEQSKSAGFAAGDPWMLSKYRIDNCDATVTFWPRHAYIWKTLNPKARIEIVPMGIDTAFWKAEPTQGKWSGEPSLFTCENSHQIKWPLDIILAFPLLMQETKAILHLHYIPLDQHRFWYPLMQANGTAYKSFSSGSYFDAPTLKNAFNSVDYYLSPVRYGDFNSVCLEARATGCKVISYRGNPYADYWLTEGDQRDMALELQCIFEGKMPRRDTPSVPSIELMGEHMMSLYSDLIGEPISVEFPETLAATS